MIKGYLISAGVGLIAGAGGVLGISKAFKPTINVQPPKVEVSCPECPQCPPSLGSEIEKIKGRNITLHLHQQLHMNSDSLFVQKLVEEVDKSIDRKLSATRLARCK